MEFEYECGTFTSASGDKLQFVCVVSVEDVVKKTVNDLRNAGLIQQLENTTDETLWLHISANKGGKSTKLILQVINVSEDGRHSIKQCMLIGFFEGKDNSARCIRQMRYARGIPCSRDGGLYNHR